MQSVHITTDVVGLNPALGEVKFVSDLRQVGGFSWFSVSSTNKTDPNDITEILLKVTLNTIQPSL